MFFYNRPDQPVSHPHNKERGFVRSKLHGGLTTQETTKVYEVLPFLGMLHSVS